MEITVSHEGKITLITVAGEIDAKTSAEAQAQILPLATTDSHLLLDMSGLTYMSSAGLRTLLLIYRTASGVGGQVVLVGLSDDLQATMEATGFLSFFTVVDDRASGMALLNGGAA